MRSPDATVQVRRRWRHRRASGVAMIEAVLSTIVISLMVVASLRTLSATRAGQVDAEARLLATHLAAELMSEIISQAYLEPDGVPVFGPEPSEQTAALTQGRSAFNDVDDYHRWEETPPQDRDGTARAHLARWSRSVEVFWADPANPNEVSLIDRGVKRIVVTVRRNNVPLVRQSALRTAAVER